MPVALPEYKGGRISFFRGREFIMQSKVETIYHDVRRVKTSLVSLGQVKEGLKYYYSKDDGLFHVSGGATTELIESTFGKGYLSSWWVGGCRNLSSTSSFTLSRDIGALNDDIVELTKTIKEVALSPDVKPRLRQALLDKVNSLYAKSQDAYAGLLLIKNTYNSELDKQKPFVKLIDEFEQTQDLLDKTAYKIEDAIRTYRNREDLRKRQEEQGFNIDEHLNRRSVSDVSSKRHLKTPAVRMSGGLLPQELTNKDALDIFRYLERYKNQLQKAIQAQNNPLLIEPDESMLSRPLAVFEDKTFVLLDEKSIIPGTQKAMKFDNRKMVMVIHSDARDAREIERAARQLNMMERYKKSNGIVQIKDAVTYLSYDKEKGNRTDQYIFIRHYDMGSLQHCMSKRRLVQMEKCQVILDVMEGLRSLHADGYVHSAVHPETIAVEKESRGARKKGIAGALLGLENVTEDRELEGLSKATDIWLLGHTMYALFKKKETTMLKHLKRQEDFTQAVIDVMKCEPLLEPPKIDIKGPIDELISRMLSPHEGDRPTIDEAIKVLKRHMHEETKSEFLIDGIAQSSEEVV